MLSYVFELFSAPCTFHSEDEDAYIRTQVNVWIFRCIKTTGYSHKFWKTKCKKTVENLLLSIQTFCPSDLDLLDSPHSCLSKGPKASESPKKRVSFDFYGKENLRQKTKLSDYRADGLTTKYDIYAQHLTKQPDLKDRLLLAKEKPLDLHRIGLDTKYNARNLLFFRWCVWYQSDEVFFFFFQCDCGYEVVIFCVSGMLLWTI